MKATVKYPIGIQSFVEIRTGGYVYIDKTQWVEQLIASGKYYFLSRPRRFGKSLLLTTIKAFYEGRKDLFNGLAIDESKHEWREHPVLFLSLASYNPSAMNLIGIVEDFIAEHELDYGRLTDTVDLSRRFANLIKSAHKLTGEKVVVLVDEYDAPLVAHLDDDQKQEANRDVLKSVCTNLKDMDEHIEFAMLTGVSRFSKMTVFSGLNNLNDISLDPRYSEICGITESELEKHFKEGLSRLAQEYGADYNGALLKLKENYDGYHFTRNSVDIYNPFSLLLALDKSEISSYWFRSGTPTFLIDRLRKEKEPFATLLNASIGEMTIADIDTYKTNPFALLFQTGYLTIKGYDSEKHAYKLGIPNKEVERGLFSELLAVNVDLEKYKLDNRLTEVRRAFKIGDPNHALNLIRSLFASIPANVTRNMPEVYHENNLYLLLKLVGIDVRTEFWTSDGRIDMVVEMPSFVYVMELKLDSSPEAALEQINAKRYALQWSHDDRRVFKIGINFSKHSRNLDSWIIEES